MTLAPGTKLGPYEILAPIGAGGMGEVYSALDARLDRFVAVKVLPPTLAQDPRQEARFRREAKAVAALSHPNILAIHDTGNEAGTVYVVMELLEGQSLRRALAGGRMATLRVAEIGAGIARGLAAAHAKGIIHRDLKPENLWLTLEGRVKILDFGLAKTHAPPSLENEGDRPTLDLSAERPTEAGMIVGTPDYMSPEQAMGRPVDARSDLFSLGAILYEMSTGERPFLGCSLGEILAAVIRDEPPIPSTSDLLETGLWSAIQRCLQKDPERRFAHALEAAEAMEAVREARGPDSPEFPSPAPRSYGLSSIAVLPFRLLGPERAADYIGDGVTEEIINSLMTLPSLHVAARTSSFAFRDRHEDVRGIGRALGVATVLEGSVRIAGPRLRVTAQLIDVATGYQMWSGRFDRTLDDLFEMQDDIARAITETLRGRLSGGSDLELAPRPDRDPKAYDLYLQGRFFYNRRAASKALSFFEAAIAADPGFSAAYSWLAASCGIHAFYGGMDSRTAWTRCREAVARAQELTPGAFDVHVADGIQEYYFGWDLARSERELKLALAVKPKAPEPYYWLGSLRAAKGDRAGAQPFLQAALDLDPLSVYPHVSFGLASLTARDFPAARDAFTHALEVDPASILARYQHGLTLVRLGAVEDGLASLHRLVDLTQRSSFGLGNLAAGLAMAGQRTEAEAVLQEIQDLAARVYVPATHTLDAVWSLGDREEALRLARRAVEDRNAWTWWYLRFNPNLEELRQDPRCQEILEGLGPG